MKELSIFIDESGDFGDYSFHSSYYIITMVFHDQSVDIQEQIRHLDAELSYLDLNNLCIHTGPIIRKEEIYQSMDIFERRRIFNKMMAFIRSIDVHFRKVMPSDYKLFQVADFICSLQLVRLKLEANQFSKSEMNFFGNQRDLKQNYLNPLKKKEFK